MKTQQQRKKEIKRVNATQRIKIKEALSFYNSQVKAKDALTLFDLAQQAIDRDILPASKYQLVSQYNRGSEECPHKYIVSIATITGVTTDYLLGLSQHETIEGNLSEFISKQLKK